MQHIALDYSNVMVDNIGAQHGIETTFFNEKMAFFKQAHKNLKQLRHSSYMFFELPSNNTELEQVRALADKLKGLYDNIVLLGIGGSALGPFSLYRALLHPYHNLMDGARRSAPRFFVLDNVDPVQIESLLDIIDIKKTLFLVITKSGSTAETISELMFFKGKLNENGIEDVSRHMVFITDPEKGKLRELAGMWQVAALNIPSGVGGRFSIFTPVGLFPAALLGIDIDALLRGADAMDKASFTEDILSSPAYMFAIIHWNLTTHGKPIHVLFPYANALYPVADWFRQIWAESLGKKVDKHGKEVYTGPTPVKALGTTDQHSQVQLYVEGPNDKVITFLEVEEFNKKGIIRGRLPFDDFNYLENKSFETLINTEKKATEIALTENNRPNMTIKLPQLTAETLGQLIYLFELATAYSGELYQINPYDQPGVEHGKVATYALMGRNGFEKKRQHIEASADSKKTYCIGK